MSDKNDYATKLEKIAKNLFESTSLSDEKQIMATDVIGAALHIRNLEVHITSCEDVNLQQMREIRAMTFSRNHYKELYYDAPKSLQAITDPSDNEVH